MKPQPIKPNCYKCIHSRKSDFSCHRKCVKPKPLAKVKANQHGVDNGWFMFPFDFDPVWLLECDSFVPTMETTFDD